MSNKYLTIALVVILIIIVAVFGYLKFSDEDGWLCQNGQWVKHGNPSASMPTTGCGVVTNNNYNDNLNTNEVPVKEVNIKVDNLAAGATIESPLVITGSARTWYFEASFPIKLLDESGKEIAAVPAQAQSDWMTTDWVPFKATLEFLVDKDQNGTLVFMNDNPSGLPEKEEKMEIPVKIKASETLTIKVFYGNEKKNPNAMDCSLVYPLERKIAKTPTTALAALNEMIKGPTEEEKNQGYYSSINTWATVNKVTIKDSTAYADFGASLEEQVGGSCKVAAIASQIKETLKQFSAVKDVVISVDGRTEDILQP